jgi:hypothetical protein
MTGDVHLELVGCPECGRPAEVVDRFVLGSTSGPVEHLKVRCTSLHGFALPAEKCPGWKTSRPTPRSPGRFS